MGYLDDKFIKSLQDMQGRAMADAAAPIRFRSVLSGVNQQLTYGVSYLPENDNSYIRNSDGETFFMIGVDRVGNNSVVSR
jgi:hypothetical protein